MSGFIELKETFARRKKQREEFIKEYGELLEIVLKSLNTNVFEGKGTFEPNLRRGCWELVFTYFGNIWRIGVFYDDESLNAPVLRIWVRPEHSQKFEDSHTDALSLREITEENVETIITRVLSLIA